MCVIEEEKGEGEEREENEEKEYWSQYYNSAESITTSYQTQLFQ